MLTHLRAATMMLLLLTGITGVVYPLVVTGIAQLPFRRLTNPFAERRACGFRLQDL